MAVWNVLIHFMQVLLNHITFKITRDNFTFLPLLLLNHTKELTLYQIQEEEFLHVSLANSPC